MVKELSHIILALVLILFGNAVQAQEIVPTNDSWKIGLIIPLSGIFEMQGAECRRGYELAYNLRKTDLGESIELAFEDDQSLPKNAVSSFQKFSTSQNVLALTIFGSSSALAVSDLSNAKTLPVLALSAHPDFIKRTKLGFSHWLDASYEADMFSKAFTRDGVRRLAIITYENDYPLAVRERIVGQQKNDNALEIVFDEKISDQSDYRSLLPKLIKQQPDAVFLNVMGPSFSNLTRLLYEAGFRGHKYSLNSNARHDLLMAAGIPASNDFTFFGPNFNETLYLKNAGGEAASSAEHTYSFSCYLGMNLLLDTASHLIKENRLTKQTFNQALREAKSIKFPEKEIPIVNRRIIYDFTEITSANGSVILKAN